MVEKSINIKTEEFKENLYKIINESQLPISTVYIVFKLVEQDLSNAFVNVIAQDRAEYFKANEEEQKEKQ